MSLVPAASRAAWILASDLTLMQQCEFDRFRGSGPGGQHRNKTESAVRLRHNPSGVSATAEERRSQGENRTRAIAGARVGRAMKGPWIVLLAVCAWFSFHKPRPRV